MPLSPRRRRYRDDDQFVPIGASATPVVHGEMAWLRAPNRTGLAAPTAASAGRCAWLRSAMNLGALPSRDAHRLRRRCMPPRFTRRDLAKIVSTGALAASAATIGAGAQPSDDVAARPEAARTFPRVFSGARPPLRIRSKVPSTRTAAARRSGTRLRTPEEKSGTRTTAMSPTIIITATGKTCGR
jgi:hypothetical protein